MLFRQLRDEIYNIDEEYYQDQFTKPLKLVSGLGFSGSVFFYTDNKDFIVKSIGRRFEVRNPTDNLFDRANSSVILVYLSL